MKTKDLVYVALFAAIVAVLGLIPKIHLISGVPITAQSLGVMLAGGILGARRGGLALLVFLVLVLAGLPLLAGGRGGLGLLAGPSGGFLLAFPLGAWCVGWFYQRHYQNLNQPLGMPLSLSSGLPLSLPRAILYNLLGGALLLYVIGIPWMALVGGFGVKQSALLMLPFIPGDVIKAVLAAMLAVAVNRAYTLLAPDSGS